MNSKKRPLKRSGNYRKKVKRYLTERREASLKVIEEEPEIPKESLNIAPSPSFPRDHQEATILQEECFPDESDSEPESEQLTSDLERSSNLCDK